jgi:hypothetical protein
VRRILLFSIGGSNDMIRQNPSIFSSKQAAGTKVVCLVVGRSFVGERLGVPYFVVVAQF